MIIKHFDQQSDIFSNTNGYNEKSRAKKREKELPETLKKALETVAYPTKAQRWHQMQQVCLEPGTEQMKVVGIFPQQFQG